MRIKPILLPLLLVATPALAQARPPAAVAPAQTPRDIQRVLSDPATAERMTNAMDALSKVFLDLPIGGIEAAVEGRQATPAERNRTLRDIEPGVDRDLAARMAEARPMIQHSMKALSDSLPGMMKGLREA